MLRYDRNGILTAGEQEKLGLSRVLIVGSGGLGGYVIEMLARLGVGHLTVMDGDVFDETNLNRQLIATEENIGEVKVLEAARRIQLINSEVELEPVYMNLDEKNATTFLEGHQVVVDCLDDIPTRKILQRAAEETQIPLVHGAIAGWWGQVTTILPGDRTLDHLYPEGADRGVETSIGNPSFSPATIASLQVAEVTKILAGKGTLLSRRILHIDLFEMEMTIFSL